MGMLRLVRAYTKREKIVKFDGCYHGHADGFLVQAGSGVATLGLPDSPGMYTMHSTGLQVVLLGGNSTTRWSREESGASHGVSSLVWSPPGFFFSAES